MVRKEHMDFTLNNVFMTRLLYLSEHDLVDSLQTGSIQLYRFLYTDHMHIYKKVRRYIYNRTFKFISRQYAKKPRRRILKLQMCHLNVNVYISACWDSNTQPPACEANALDATAPAPPPPFVIFQKDA